MIDSLQANLLSPMILAFALGIVAVAVRSDLRIPDEKTGDRIRFEIERVTIEPFNLRQGC